LEPAQAGQPAPGFQQGSQVHQYYRLGQIAVTSRDAHILVYYQKWSKYFSQDVKNETIDQYLGPLKMLKQILLYKMERPLYYLI
jgi:hypothetical protein